MVHAGGYECGYVCVEADTCDIEKQPLTQLTRVQLPDVGAHGSLDRPRGVEWNAQLAGKAITGSAGNDAERRP